MDVFALRDTLVDEYSAYVRSFLRIRDPRIRAYVDQQLTAGVLWPDPLVQLNPSYAFGPSIDDLVGAGALHPLCHDVFRIKKADGTSKALRLYRHQAEAIEAANAGDNFLVTTGTGSGKSLAYIIPIVNHVLRRGSGRGIQAIIVYPMNALANSQLGELDKFLTRGFAHPPVTFRRYTGQESEEERADIVAHPPDILLTNYVMLELILTRPRERPIVDAARGLGFVVLDELHTYRGRQGADVALLMRRLRECCEAPQLRCIGTSATLADRDAADGAGESVSEVATQLFGAVVKANRVIGENLRRVTAVMTAKDTDTVSALRERLLSEQASLIDFGAFLADPLTQWIESTFGVQADTASGRLRRAAPMAVTGEGGAAARLSSLTGVDQERCARAIREALLAGQSIVDPETELPVFAFRVNQFISRGDTAYASLDDPDQRTIAVEGQQYVPGDRTRLLLPLVFCRECGQEYYAVARRADRETGTVRYVSRDIQSWRPESPDEEYGYLYRDPDGPWDTEEADHLDLLPQDWIEQRGDQRRVKRDRIDRVPRVVHLDTAGLETGDGLPFLYIGRRFDFCPNCHVAYDARQRSDYLKLASLDAGGRSSATTTLALSVIRALRASNVSAETRKLLSFTDNRQDAALQAGHLNDFVEVGMLRAALYRAVRDAGTDGLRHDLLPQAVYTALGLPFERYASDPTVRYRAREETDRALREVLRYRLYHDLRRGWRINAPNLEQCGLLEIGYDSLDELCADENNWANTHPALVGAAPETRRAVGKTLLDLLRRSLAIDEPSLTQVEQERLKSISQQRLIGPWAIDAEESLETASIVYPRSIKPGDYGGNVYLSSRSGFGQYLRRAGTFPEYFERLSTDDAQTVIRQLLAVLSIAGLVAVVEDDGDPNAPGYQVKAAALIWKVGDGQSSYRDPIRVPQASIEGPGANAFFVDLCTRVAADLGDVSAAEHTAQVRSDVREEREERFRSGALPILFCSPTMELGIDIAQLNVVNMRNVPPSPANYAQRSGRAGRSGQPALVFTYCTSKSPHDQYYFHHPGQMVAGAVTPPRLDLANEDLVLAHLDAVWLAEAHASLHGSLRDILDLSGTDPSLALLESVKADIASQQAKERATRRFQRILGTFADELADADWYDEGWLARNLATVEGRFDAACERWRGLYRSALAQARAQTSIIHDASRSPGDRAQAQRLRAEAEQQLDLLRAATGESLVQSDFDSYRYFASEGFLPGYSFPRLPISAYVPARRGKLGKDEFLSRPRFLAISEFGPRSIIYHEGSRYIVNRVIMPVREDGQEALTRRAKLCPRCGFLHPLAAADDGPDRCECCDALLDAPLSGLLRMQNVSTKRRDRINSDEEERTRMGYDLTSAVRFAAHGGRRTEERAEVKTEAGAPLMTLRYGQSATIWRINRGWRNRRDDARPGFVLDVERGYWQKNEDDEGDPDDPMSPITQRVIPYVEDRRNCLLIAFPESLPVEAMASIQPALKGAIQLLYQLEEDELAAEPLPSAKDRRIILLYESAEGGAGVLRRLVQDAGALARVARAALEICHYDAETGEDRGRDGKRGCEAACYDCLMSYYNQPDHELLDRHLIRDLLMALSHATVTVSPVAESREEHFGRLLATCESALERDWLRALDGRRLRLPDAGQVNLVDCLVRPDFIYREQRLAIFVDGPHHQMADVQQRDREAEDRLMDRGYTWIRFALPIDGWARIFEENDHLFGPAG